MATVTLTARRIGSLEAAQGQRAEFWDATVPGFGLRVTPGGIKTWTIRYRHRGRLYRMTLSAAMPIAATTLRVV